MSKLRAGNRVVFNGEVPQLKKVKSDVFDKNGVQCVYLEDYDGEVNVEYLTKVGELSDGYHTYNELYEHRMILFKIVCDVHKDKAWKSWKHSDGTMFDHSFIVGVNTPEGQYTYHYREEDYDLFDVKELEFAPEYDGHLPKDITRLLSL